ncbi:spore coat U domain-containing protein [Novosphingobium aerophilum]|uniref:Csu type fimbrial protein n=1 Tax=Novosphingobium TaxID=165696 RepID=UPI0017E0267F|nr:MULTISPECIES: spore coat U domain-containing protein [unclassified Novosphingobium]WRT96096.1 spore coat U domain-containing protein [Novosphingobium sp. RL4]
MRTGIDAKALPAPALAILVAPCVAAAMLPAAARADTTAQFAVTANITAGCLVDGLGSSGNAGLVGRLDFGVDSTFSRATRTATSTATQAIRLRCTPGVNLTMTVNGGNHAASGMRNLQRGTDASARISYALCRDAGCTQPIAIGGAPAVPVTGTNSEDVRLPIYGSLTLSGTLPPGTYTDSLIVTLSW